MAEEPIINRVRSETTDVPLRSVNYVGSRRLVIDEPARRGGPGEEVGPADVFLAGVSSCGVMLVQDAAMQSGVRLERAAATIEGVRSPDDPSWFQRVDLRFELTGPTREQAEELVASYQRR